MPESSLTLVETHKTALPLVRAALLRCYEKFIPPPDLSVSDWAIQFRILPPGTSARPGPFIPEKFQIEMMDVILDPNVHEIDVIKCTQMGYSDGILNNIIGYFIDSRPQPLMMVQPTIDGAEDYGKKRITPMIEACSVLRERVRGPISRRAGNTLTLKEFPGGYLKLTGANAGTGLRSDPVPVVLFDEVDAYPLDVGGEGDPIAIATRRTDSFANYKIVKGSTPGKPKGISPIENAFLKSDRRRFHVPCPHCGHMQVLWWRDPATVDAEGHFVPAGMYRLYYERDEFGIVQRESVAYVCSGCKAKINERYKRQMLNAGQWIPEFPGRPAVGFHINALYSPWRENWHELAQEWSDANVEGNPEKLKAFINLRLGETWEEDADAVASHALKNRQEKYSENEQVAVPHGVGLLTAAVDVQGDRLEVVVKGWGAKEESWLIAYEQFYGDPGQEEVWGELDTFLLQQFLHEGGQRLTIRATMIDSGGAHTDSVYKFAKARQNRRVFACKGAADPGKEILGKPSLNNRYKVRLYVLGTDTAKDRIFARMKIPLPGPGYMHLPVWADEEYLEQLTSEKSVRRYRPGRGAVRLYIKTRIRNEALDLEVYALAALYSLGPLVLGQLGQWAASYSAGEQGPLAAPRSRQVRNPGIT